MPFVDGESLRSRLRRDGPLPARENLSGFFGKWQMRFQHAHASGVIQHRDVKPDNVLLSGRHAFLADYGVARAVAAHATEEQTVTGTSLMAGTPALHGAGAGDGAARSIAGATSTRLASWPTNC